MDVSKLKHTIMYKDLPKFGMHQKNYFGSNQHTQRDALGPRLL